MKKIVIWVFTGLFLTTGVWFTFAQGTIYFRTFNGDTARGRTFLPPELGGSGPGPAYVGQLYWSDTSDGTFTVLGTPEPFDTIGPFWILGSGLVTVPGHDAGSRVFFELRVWNVSAGDSYESALTSPLLTAYGISEVKSRVLGGIDSEENLFAPPSFNHFANLTLTAVPEPSVIALTGLGLASILILRRRKTWSQKQPPLSGVR